MRAAKELNLTDGAVSRAVREMEAEVGFPLFQRGNRSIVPTHVARTLAEDVRSVLDRLASALAQARRTSGPGRPITLSCEPTFLIRWLIPRLADLQEVVGPARELRLVSAGGAVSFARDGIDLAIRRADFEMAGDVLAKPFLDEHVGPVCRSDLAPRLLGSGAIEGVLLHTATRPHAWANWSRLTGTELRPAREIRFEHFYLSLQAAVAGAGVAIGPIALVSDDLANGALLAPRGFVADGSQYVLMTAREGYDRACFDTVLDWLRTRGNELTTIPG
ncbi:LysR family transcriptional regulator [Pendulispora albinea]|uniref:LysR family transcriptional regulator n=2 Tax=Pendulispora albinea TaxID=2741071 RepID=A0ABZ2LPQ2_9BACT